jgi:large subunit ribosomal protein L4
MLINLIKTAIIRAAAPSISNVPQLYASRSLCSSVIERPSYRENREIWVENLDTEKENKLEILELDKEIFGATPRIDIIHQNVEWQRKYRFVSFAHTKLRSEVRGGGRKPWPQKGLGRARHGSIRLVFCLIKLLLYFTLLVFLRSPLWRGGGVVHGPRSPTTHFYMLPYYTRILGLTSTLSAKLAQDDLKVVRDLDIPTEDKTFIKNLIESRNWGPSVLFVDE